MSEQRERKGGGWGAEGEGARLEIDRRDVDGKRERSEGRRRERERERERASQGGRIESYASTVLQPEEDKMRKTLGLTVYSAKVFQPIEVRCWLVGCHRGAALRITACVSLRTVRVSCLCACP